MPVMNQTRLFAPNRFKMAVQKCHHPHIVKAVNPVVTTIETTTAQAVVAAVLKVIAVVTARTVAGEIVRVTATAILRVVVKAAAARVDLLQADHHNVNAPERLEILKSIRPQLHKLTLRKL